MQLLQLYPKHFFSLILLLLSGCFSCNSPEPVEVSTPVSVSTEVITKEPAIIIEIKNDLSVWHSEIKNGVEVSTEKINTPTVENLNKVIATYEKKYEGQKKTYMIKGDSEAPKESFEYIIKALKGNKIDKYSIVVGRPEQSVKIDTTGKR